MPRQPKATKRGTEFAVGDRVLIHFGTASTMPAEIIEDRGPLGVGGRQIFRVTVIDPSLDEPMSFEVRADDLSLQMQRPAGRRSLRPRASTSP